MRVFTSALDKRTHKYSKEAYKLALGGLNGFASTRKSQKKQHFKATS